MGDHERALKYYIDAKATFERSDTLLAMNMSEACNGAGAACWHLGRPREAEAYYKMALDFLAKSTDAIDASRTSVFAAVGSLHMIGRLGLPALLAERGYKVERIDFKP